MGHDQVFAKVNVPVDIGVRSIIEALSAFDGLQTVESCEGPPIWVSFRYGRWWEHPWRDLAAFLFGFLGPELAALIGDRASVQAVVSETGAVLAEITVREGVQGQPQGALTKLREGWETTPLRN